MLAQKNEPLNTEIKIRCSAFYKDLIIIGRLLKEIGMDINETMKPLNFWRHFEETALETRFDLDDLNAIKTVINDKLLPSITLNAKDDALELITVALQDVLKEVDAFNLFMIWENLINEASGEIVKNFSSIHEPDEYWQRNLISSFFRMAHAQVGK